MSANMNKAVVRNLVEDFETPARCDGSTSDTEELLNVFLRIRPFLLSERKQNCQPCVEIESSRSVVLQAPKDSVTYKNSQHGATQVCHQFTFTHVFSPDTDQQSLFDKSMLEMMRYFLDGQNCLVFAFGATNAGKTYTMQGFQDDPGVLPRALDVLFNSIQDCLSEAPELMPIQYDTVRVLSPEEIRQEEMLKENLLHHGLEWEGEASTYLSCDSTVSRSTASLFSDDSLNATRKKNSRENLTNLKENIHRLFASMEHRVRDETILSVDQSISYTVWVSFCEIYNENIHDLLDCDNQSIKRRPILKLAGDKRGNIYVKGCRQFCVTSADEAVKLILIGQKNLRVASTKLNQNSSRSHSIFSVKLIRSCTDGRSHKASVQLLSFCDLAGSERYAKTQSQGDRLTEAKNINTSLLVLGRCIHMLRENQCNKDNMKLIPFRESKLTHLLQNFFVKKGKVSMIVNISQDGKVFDENLHVLKYSAVAKQVRIIPDLDTTRPQRTTKVSLVLAQGFGSRSSVAWSTTSSDATDLKSVLTDTVFEASEEDEDNDAIGDKTLSELYSELDNLRQELAKEKKEKQTLESEIRTEVAAEVQVCIEEMEKYYEERLTEVETEAEELAERRMASYVRALNREREASSAHNSDKEDETVKRLEIQLRNQEELILSLKAEIEEMNSKTKESSDNRTAVLAELGCNDLLEVKQLWQKQKDLVEEMQLQAQCNADVAASQQAEKGILEEQLQCLREKFASEVNKTLMLQHEITKRESEFAQQKALIQFLSEVGCTDVVLLREQWLKSKDLQEKIKLQGAEKSDLSQMFDVVQRLGFDNIEQVREEWDKNKKLLSDLMLSNGNYTTAIETYRKNIADLNTQVDDLKKEVGILTQAKNEVEHNFNLQLTTTQNLLDDLGVNSLASLRDEWIIRFTEQSELIDSTQAFHEQISTLQQELSSLQKINENNNIGKVAAEQDVALLRSDKMALSQKVQDINEKFKSLSELNHCTEADKCMLEDKVLSCEETIRNLQDAKHDLGSNILMYENTIATLRLRETELETKVSEYEKTINSLRDTTKTLEARISSYEQVVHENNTFTSESSATSPYLENMHSKNIEDKILLQEKILNLQDSKNELERKIVSCEASEIALKKVILSLKEEHCTILAEKDLLCQHLEVARQKNHTYEDRIEEYEALQQEVDSLKCSLAEHAVKSDVTDDLKTLEAARSNLEEAKSSLEHDLQTLKQKSVELSQSFEREVASLKATKLSLEQDVVTLEQKYSEQSQLFEQETALLKATNEALIAENSTLHQKLLSEDKTKNGNKAKLQSLEADLAAKISECCEKELEVAQLEDDLKETTAILEVKNQYMHQVTEKTEELEKNVEKLQKDLESIKVEKEKLVEHLNCKAKQCIDLEQSLQELHNKMEEFQTENLKLTEKLNIAISKLSDKECVVEKLHNNLETVQAENVELTKQLKQQLQLLSDGENLEEKLCSELAIAQAEKSELNELFKCKSQELMDQLADKTKMVTSLKMDLEESRKMEDDSACKHIRSKNKLQEILTLFGVKTLDDIKAKMNEYEPLKSKTKQLDEEIAIMNDKEKLLLAQIKEQSEKIFILEAEDHAKEMAYNEHLSNVSQELRTLQEVLIEEFGSFSLKQLRKNIAKYHILKEEKNIMQAKNQELEALLSKLQEEASEREHCLHSETQALKAQLSALQEKSCDCGEFKEPVIVKKVAKKPRSRKTQNKTDLTESGRSGVTTRSSRRRQKSVLEESNSQDATSYHSDSSTSDGNINSRSSSLRSRRLYKENVSLLDSSPQTVDCSKQTSTYSVVMKNLQRS